MTNRNNHGLTNSRSRQMEDDMSNIKLTAIQFAVLRAMAANPQGRFKAYNSVSNIHPKANLGTLRQLFDKGLIKIADRGPFSYPQLTKYKISRAGKKFIADMDARDD